MKLKITLSLVVVFLVQLSAKAQVWYPEGVFIHNQPSLITVDNLVVTISRVGPEGTNSLWQVCINDGKEWRKLPLLELSKSAEITDIRQYLGHIYVSGNFTFNNATSNALVRCQLVNGKWEGLAKFMKASQPASITTMDVQNGQLIIGGNFFNIVTGVRSDTMSYLARYNTITNQFNYYFDGCKQKCNPDNPVIDIASNDSIVAISGQFTRIGGHKSLNLVRIFKHALLDTFINTPKLMEKLALNGPVIYATAGVLKDKHIFMVTKTFTDINFNLDSSLFINEILVHEGSLIANGAFNIASNVSRTNIIRFDNTKWVDISNNYRNASYIASGRSILFAIGNPAGPVSVWNPNKFVVRFFPHMSLLKIKVFLDSNNNCIFDKNERPVAKQYIKHPSLNRGAFTNEKGLAEFLVPNLISGVIGFRIKPLKNHVPSLCAVDTVTTSITPGRFTDSVQFAINRVPGIRDIRVTLSSPKGSQVLKDKKVTYFLTYENVGSTNLTGTVRLKKNPFLKDVVTEPLAKEIDNTTYEWTYTNIVPGEKHTVAYIGLATDTSFSHPGEFQASASSSISSGSAQYTEDDSDSIPQEVSTTVNAFRKEVYPTPAPGDSITYLDVNDRDLRYHISFSNFSTDTVYYAVVIDTLDLNLDMSYIQETGSNEAYYTEVQTDPNNQYKGILIWHFPNIKLTPNPLKNFEILSSGSYIGFKVVTKPLSNGYMLKNIASVFYDNEYAGTTNAVYCTVAINSIDELEGLDDKFRVFPNPFSHEVTLAYDFKAGDVISVYNTNGQLVYTGKADTTTDSESIDLANLGSGIYVVQVFSEGKLLQRKMLKL